MSQVLVAIGMAQIGTETRARLIVSEGDRLLSQSNAAGTAAADAHFPIRIAL